MSPRNGWIFRVTLALFCLFIFAGAAAAADSPIGSWQFISDSDGASADNGVTITLSFNLSGVAFSAVGPGENIADSGSYSTNGSTITINLPKIGRSAQNKPYTINVNTMILPFKVFSDGPGTSTWSRVITPSGNGNGTGNPPPQPPNPPNNPNPPGNTDTNNPPPKQPKPPTSETNTHNQPPTQPGPDDSKFAPYVGDWVGNGWSWETRFRQSRKDFTNQLFNGIPDQMANRNNIQGNVMEVMVSHDTEYAFTVDEHGHIQGAGEIVYNVSPNLCGLAALTKQVNLAVNEMKYISLVYKLANEIGTGMIHTLNKEWLEEENELSSSIESLKEVESRIPPENGRYAATTGEGEKELEKDVIKSFDDMGAKPGTRRLAYDTILERCTTTPNYDLVGDLPCHLVTNAPTETEIKSDMAAGAKGLSELYEDKFWDQTKEDIEKRMEQLNGTEKESEIGCLANGPENLEKLYDLIKEKFNEDYTEEAKGAATGGAVGTLGNAVKNSTLQTEEQLTQNAVDEGLAPTQMFEGMDPTKMVDLMLSVPGVTQVTYAYKALPHGPEARTFRLSGYIEPSSGGAATMHLTMDMDVSGGKKNLEVDYMVNYKWSQGFFPIWTPFPDKPAQVQLSGTVTLPKQTWGDGEGEGAGEEGAPEPPTKLTMKSPFAMYHDTGTHRNGVAPWQEYEYFWFAHKVTEPPKTETSQSGATEK